MAMIPLRINGYSYTIGCGEGEEAHLTAMAASLDSRIVSLKSQAGQLGEARLLVMAALQMADELHDLKLAMNASEDRAALAREAAQRAAETAEAAEARAGQAQGRVLEAERRAALASSEAHAGPGADPDAQAAVTRRLAESEAARLALLDALDRMAGRMEGVATRLSDA